MAVLRIYIFCWITCSIQTVASAQDASLKYIHYFGLQKTKLDFVEGFCNPLKNRVFDSIAIEKTVRFFKTLPSFSNVTYDTERLDSSYILNLFFEENKTFLPAVTAWRSINSVTVRMGASENNFLGRNISVGGFYQYNNYHSYYAGIKAPYLFNKSTGLEINNQNLSSLEPLYFANESVIYKYQLTNIEVLLIKTIRLQHTIKAGISFFKDDYSIFSKLQTSNNFQENVMLNKRSTKVEYQYNNLDWHYYIPSGFRQEVSLQRVITSGINNNFFAFYSTSSYFKSFRKKNNTATRIIVGLANNISTPFAPFAIDNNANLRGTGIVSDRASAIIGLNNEYRKTVYSRKNFVLQANFFVDAATWRNAYKPSFFSSTKTQAFLGAGCRVLHKKVFNAIFRIDYGKSLVDKSGGFVFGIGQYF